MKNEKDVLKLIKSGGQKFSIKILNITMKNLHLKVILKILKYIKTGEKGGYEYVYLYNMKDKNLFSDTYKDKFEKIILRR